MVYKLAPEFSPGAVVCDENGKVIPTNPAIDKASAAKTLQAIADHQEKCKADAAACLQFYFNERGAINLHFLEQWLAENQPLDRWFFVHLIEVAGQRFLDRSIASYRAEIARSKNAAPRAWCLSQWESRTDKGQSKASFARQYAPMVKKSFSLIVTPETIARDWLPRANK